MELTKDNEKKMIKKADIILLIAIIAIGSLISFLSFNGNTAGDTVLVSVNGEAYGVYSLDEDREIEIVQNGHTNNITIKDGHVQMTYSDCKNQDCVKMGRIHETKDKIVCLPNKIIVQIESQNGGELDAISR